MSHNDDSEKKKTVLWFGKKGCRRKKEQGKTCFNPPNPRKNDPRYWSGL